MAALRVLAIVVLISLSAEVRGVSDVPTDADGISKDISTPADRSATVPGTADGFGTGEDEPEELPVAQALVSSNFGAEDDAAGVSPAEELRIAAQKAGYNITDMTLDLATHGTEEELEEMLPQPLAAALIQRRRRPDLRERLIGMTFLGQPVPLDRVPRRPFMPDSRGNRRRSGSGPIRRIPTRFAQNRNDFIPSEASSRPRVLKPLSLPGNRAKIIFPPHLGRPEDTSIPRLRPQESEPLGFSLHGTDNELSILTEKNLAYDGPLGRPFGQSSRPQNKPFEVFDLRDHPIPNIKLRPQRPLQDFPPIKDDFDNSLGPDFGPVIYETDPNIQTLIPNPFQSFETDKTPSKTPSPFDSFHSSSGSKTPSRTTRPKQFVPSKPFSTGFSNIGGSSHSAPDRGTTFKRDRKSQCTQYTETICLDADNYPHAEILASLEGDKGRTNVLIAEVRNQSADNLVDGITARQEAKYNYSHYFGSDDKRDSLDRRQDNDVTRDFASEGGYLCPSEVKYARPKRARNSKGEWKFVVNMDKYTQTIRMEKCIKPGGACSYVSHHYRATCSQVHNYQRLLAWQEKRGLHMDIFKVPSCCTCHIQGYSYAFPPLNQNKARLSPADSLLLESRSNEDKTLPIRGPGVVRDDRLPNRNVNDYLPPQDTVGAAMPPNGGPFTRPPASKRPLPFERIHQRINRGRRPGASVPNAGVRRMDISGSYESRKEVSPPSNYGPIGGGGLDLSRPQGDQRLQKEHPRSLSPSEDLQSYRTRGSSSQSYSPGRQGGVRNTDAMGVSRHGSVNYDYHPILQFFDGYQ